jgi:hypothetical protein
MKKFLFSAYVLVAAFVVMGTLPAKERQPQSLTQVTKPQSAAIVQVAAVTVKPNERPPVQDFDAPLPGAPLSTQQRKLACLIGLAKLNANAPDDYTSKGEDRNLLRYSSRGHHYECNFNSQSGVVFSSPGWQSLKPTATLSITRNACVLVSLYDPGFRLRHELNSCAPPHGS